MYNTTIHKLQVGAFIYGTKCNFAMHASSNCQTAASDDGARLLHGNCNFLLFSFFPGDHYSAVEYICMRVTSITLLLCPLCRPSLVGAKLYIVGVLV